MVAGKRKTTDEHLKDGTYRADRHGPKTPVLRYANGIPQPPDDLDELGARLWHDVIAQTPPQLLCELDWASLTQLCRTHSIVEQLSKCLQDDPLEVKLYAAWTAAMGRFLTMCGRWGLTPLDRAKTRTDGRANDKPQSPLEQLKAAKLA